MGEEQEFGAAGKTGEAVQCKEAAVNLCNCGYPATVLATLGELVAMEATKSRALHRLGCLSLGKPRLALGTEHPGCTSCTACCAL